MPDQRPPTRTVPDLKEQRDAHSTVDVGVDRDGHTVPGAGVWLPQVVLEFEQHGPAAVLRQEYAAPRIPAAAPSVILEVMSDE
jgi:hypothetical protein